MSTFAHDDHLSAERMQAFLDGDLLAADASVVQAHVDACPRCRSELSGWEVLFDELEELPALTPSPAFRARILEAVPADTSARGRIRSAIAASGGEAEHIPAGRLQDHLEGRVPARIAARIDTHLDTCAVCRSELAAFRSLSVALDELPTVTPSAEFGERVLAAWRVEQIARVAMAPTTRWERLVAWARSRTPSTRQGWAAALGVAVAPAVIVSLVIRAVFSNPLVTVGNLAAFVRLQIGDLAAALATRADAFLHTAGLDALARTTLEMLSSPPVAASAATVASGLTFTALWVVYRFLIASQPADRPYAHVTR